MARGAAARRYAKALFQIAQEASEVDRIRGEIEALGALLRENQELDDVLMRPLHPVAQRRAVLEAVADGLGAGSTLRAFFSFLIDQRRLLDLAVVEEEFARLADEAAGRVKVQVRSATPLSEAQHERLKRALSARTGQEVEIEHELDPSLIGGVVAQVGDQLYDGSLRTQLQQLRSGLGRG